MKTKTLGWGWTLTLLCLVAASVAPAIKADEGDPPGRVARLSFTQGKVSFQPSGENEWN